MIGLESGFHQGHEIESRVLDSVFPFVHVNLLNLIKENKSFPRHHITVKKQGKIEQEAINIHALDKQRYRVWRQKQIQFEKMSEMLFAKFLDDVCLSGLPSPIDEQASIAIKPRF